MKRIFLKTTKLSNSTIPEGFEFDYKKELLQIVEVLPEGATVSQMASALKVQAVLKSAHESFYLEDADHQWLSDKVKANKWRFVAPELVEFEKAITEAATEDAPHLTTAATA